MSDIKCVATPLARRIAAAHGVDLAGMRGSGPRGRVMRADVLAHVSAPAPAVAPATYLAPRPLYHPAPSDRPLATAMLEADVGAGPGAALLAHVLRAAARLLPEHRLLNARWDDDGIVLRRRAHIAAGVAGPGGLRWALVRDAGDLNLRGLTRALSVAGDDLGAATFAVVALAEGAGWQAALPPLPGTAAALSVGAPRPRAVAAGDGLAVRRLAALTLSYDARVLDHAQAARFLVELRALLARPE